MTVGEVVYELRKSEGLTQSNLALAAGISERYVNFIERDKKKPSNKVLIRIAKAVNRDVTTFYSVNHDTFSVIFSPPGTYRINDLDQNLLLNEKRLYTYCLNLYRGNKEKANNLAQATRTEALLYHYRYHNQCLFHVWLYKIAYNLYAGIHKKDRRLTFVETYIETGEIKEEEQPDINLIEYINRLPEKQRELVRLRLSKYSYQEIGKILKIKPLSAKSKFWHIKGRLKQLIENKEAV